MPDHRLPVHPSLEELEQEAQALVRDGVSMAEAQHELARSYGAPDWNRLVLACRLVDAIWADDLATVQS